MKASSKLYTCESNDNISWRTGENKKGIYLLVRRKYLIRFNYRKKKFC